MPTDRKKVKQWGKKSAGVKGLPSAGALVKEARKDTVQRKPMTMAEKIEALDLYSELKDVAAVAVKMNRSEESIRKFVAAYKSSTKVARMTLEAGAAKLAHRVVRDANVEESLEVLDRLDVVNKKRDKMDNRPTHSLLIVGMPNARDNNPLPLPSQKQIEAAIEAEVVAPKPPIPNATEAADGN